jgi:hypothetical protein
VKPVHPAVEQFVDPRGPDDVAQRRRMRLHGAHRADQLADGDSRQEGAVLEHGADPAGREGRLR